MTIGDKCDEPSYCHPQQLAGQMKVEANASVPSSARIAASILQSPSRVIITNRSRVSQA